MARKKTTSTRLQRPKIPQRFLDEAKRVYGTKNSAYRSAYAKKIALQNDPTYKKAVEYFERHKSPKQRTLGRWFKEEWVQIRPYIERHEVVVCGSKKGTQGKACRPLKRVAQNTPVTLPELLKKVTKQKLLDEVRKKEHNPRHKIGWKRMLKKTNLS